jgi:hypothetical protein
MLRDEAITRLVDLLSSDDSGLKLNTLWAIKNLLWKSASTVKKSVMDRIGWHTLVGYVHVSLCCYLRTTERASGSSLTRIPAFRSKPSLCSETLPIVKRTWT